MYRFIKYLLLLAVILGLSWCCLYVWRKMLAPYLVRPSEAVPAEQASASQEASEPAVAEPAASAPLVAAEPAVSGDLQMLLAQAKQELQEERLLVSRETAYSGLEKCEAFSPSWLEFAQVIDSVNKIFMNSSAPSPEKKRYVIVAGDRLMKIAYRLNTTVDALQKLNSLSRTSSVIYPGNPLVYIEGTWSIKVSKRHFLLCLCLDDKLYRIYRISTGRHDRTPSGNFIVSQKQMNPAWTYEGKVIPFGDPQNVLGTRWIGLKPVDEVNIALTGYGIHGTTEPENIGKPASLGCIRMLNEEVEELYDFIPSSFKEREVKVIISE